jgi:hypothetical protein
LSFDISTIPNRHYHHPETSLRTNKHTFCIKKRKGPSLQIFFFHLSITKRYVFDFVSLFELHSGVTVVLRSTSEYKETLIAGEDFFYVDSASLPEMQVADDVHWTIFNRKNSGSYVVARFNNKVERKLSRVLMNVINDRSLVVTFANNCFYDLRRENLIVCPVGGLDRIEGQRQKVMKTLRELPTKIKNALMEKNGHSSPQEHVTATSLKIETESTFNLTVEIQGIKFKATQLSEKKKIKAIESIQFLKEIFAVVSQ